MHIYTQPHTSTFTYTITHKGTAGCNMQGHALTLYHTIVHALEHTRVHTL